MPESNTFAIPELQASHGPQRIEHIEGRLLDLEQQINNTHEAPSASWRARYIPRTRPVAEILGLQNQKSRCSKDPVSPDCPLSACIPLLH